MILLACLSNMFIPTVMSEILDNPQKEFLVLVDQEGMNIFFNNFTFPNAHLAYIKNNNSRWGWDGNLALLRLFKRHQITEIHFYHDEYGGSFNWLIKHFSNKCIIKYLGTYGRLPYPERNDRQARLYRFKMWVKYGILFDILEQSGCLRGIPSLPQGFFKDCNVTKESYPINHDAINKYLSNTLGNRLPDADIILLTGSVVADRVVDERVYIEGIDKVINICGAERTVSKCHPRYSDLYGKEKDLAQIDKSIPANLLLMRYDTFVGYLTTTLVEAAQMGKKSISLVKLIKPNNLDIVNDVLAFFNQRLQGKGEILYPESWEELKKLLWNQ